MSTIMTSSMCTGCLCFEFVFAVEYMLAVNIFSICYLILGPFWGKWWGELLTKYFGFAIVEYIKGI